MRTVLDFFSQWLGCMCYLIHFLVVAPSALMMARVFCTSIVDSVDLLLRRWLGRVLYMIHLVSCMIGRVSYPNLVYFSLFGTLCSLVLGGLLVQHFAKGANAFGRVPIGHCFDSSFSDSAWPFLWFRGILPQAKIEKKNVFPKRCLHLGVLAA